MVRPPLQYCHYWKGLKRIPLHDYQSRSLIFEVTVLAQCKLEHPFAQAVRPCSALVLRCPSHFCFRLCSRSDRFLSHSQRKVRSAAERRILSIMMLEHSLIRANIGPTLKKFHPKILNTPNYR